MSITTHGNRFVLVTGEHTAERVALPMMGSLSVGSDPAGGVAIAEEGVEATHAMLYLDHGIGLEARAEGIEVTAGSGRRARRRVSPGETVEIEIGDVVKLGDAELSFVAVEAIAPGPRVIARATFLAALAERGRDPTRASQLVARLALTGTDPARALDAALSGLGAGHALLELDRGSSQLELAVLLPDITQEEAVRSLQRLALEIGRARGELRAGLAQIGEGDAGRVLELAAERIAPIAALEGPGRIWVSDDPAMRRVMELVDRAAESAANVLLLGETGTGKDLLAQLIHDKSARAARPFVRVSCVELSDGLTEAGPGALISRARGGTVHLDEILALSPRAQLSLGYLLDAALAASDDVRFIASSNQDLAAAVARGELRKDLYYRLDQLSITIPALRQRASDVVPLAELFLELRARALGRAVPRLSEAAKERLTQYVWPGNVRELRNVVERALALAPGQTIGTELLGIPVARDGAPLEEVSSSSSSTSSEEGDAPKMSLRDEIAALEKRRIIEALRKFPTQREAAEALNMPMRTFLNRLDALGIPRARGGGAGNRGKDEDDGEE